MGGEATPKPRRQPVCAPDLLGAPDCGVDARAGPGAKREHGPREAGGSLAPAGRALTSRAALTPVCNASASAYMGRPAMSIAGAQAKERARPRSRAQLPRGRPLNPGRTTTESGAARETWRPRNRRPAPPGHRVRSGLGRRPGKKTDDPRRPRTPGRARATPFASTRCRRRLHSGYTMQRAGPAFPGSLRRRQIHRSRS